ncbi:hypothetical protein HZA75_00440 [Candidatus Roizmanbacteria bacterium]|nr:hypothetical protein [Candidatus Roizmanbacteria bacterium]
MSDHKPQEKEFSFKSYFVPLTNLKAIHFIIFTGVLVFLNNLLNPFQGDDIGQIVNNPQISKLSNIPTFFFQSLVYSGLNSLKILHIYYKPILFTTFAMVYSLFGSISFPFHVLQLLLHIGNTLLLFFIFSRFFKRGLVLFLSLIFLIHPINSESVIYIADMQETLFMFFGLLALLLIMNIKGRLISFTRLSIVAILSLCSLLSKETGVLFLVTLLLYSLVFMKANIKRFSDTVIATILLYLFLRFIASLNSGVIMMSLSPIQQASFLVKLLTIPKIIFYYLSKFVLPIHLAIGQDWVVKNTDFANFYLPLIVDSIFFLALIFFGIFIYNKRKKIFKPFIFFTSWFCFGMIINLQIIPLDVTVADRWFYFPIIGLLGISGLLIQNFYEKIATYTFKMIVIIFACFILVILSMLTFVRNTQWQSRFTLLNHDVQYAQSPLLDSFYGGMLIINGQLDKAKPYLEESISLNPQLGHNFNNLAIYYEKKNDYTRAKALYWENIHRNSEFSNTYIYISYENLSHLALNDNNPKEAKSLAEKAVSLSPFDAHALEYLAIAEYQLGEKDAALQIIQKLYKYSPNSEVAQLYYLIKSNKHFTLNAQLGSTLIY